MWWMVACSPTPADFGRSPVVIDEVMTRNDSTVMIDGSFSDWVEILNVSYAKNLSTEIVLSQQILSERFAHNFSLALATKDARIAAETAESVGYGESTPRHFARVLEEALGTIGDTDLTRVYQYLDGLWGRTHERQPAGDRP